MFYGLCSDALILTNFILDCIRYTKKSLTVPSVTVDKPCELVHFNIPKSIAMIEHMQQIENCCVGYFTIFSDKNCHRAMMSRSLKMFKI